MQISNQRRTFAPIIYHISLDVASNCTRMQKGTFSVMNIHFEGHKNYCSIRIYVMMKNVISKIVIEQIKRWRNER